MKEIFRLKEMLEHENIPFEFEEHKDLCGFQIGYPTLPKNKKCICSVIQHKYSYGSHFNLLELWGFDNDDVEGFLTADLVFDKIICHYKKEE